MNASSTINPVDVLKFWHMVEFFVPFNLDDVCSKPNAVYQLTEDQLDKTGNNYLPWVSPVAFTRAKGDEAYECRYNLYLLPFDKKEVTRVSKEVFADNLDDIERVEFEEKFDDEGKTCFAKLTVDSDGRPDFDKLSLSTLPWALGILSNRNFDALNYKQYEKDQEKLKSFLQALSSYHDDPHSKIISDHIKPGVLTAKGLVILLTAIKHWAGFAPNYSFVVLFETIKGKKKDAQNSLETDAKKQTNNKKEVMLLGDPSESLNETIVSTESGENDINDNQLDILNSFYIEDIEKVINHISNHNHKPILSYINGVLKQQKNDLYAKANSRMIVDKLNPYYLNHGKWPTDDGYFMSLMQQFAINECFYPSNDSSLFSVNGPPGTGKTTLLQDIIAENIVKRARILATFKNSADAFTGKLTVNFSNNVSAKIRLLNESLTGFEMLVVSSNNAAVENISKELPLKRKLPEKYQENCEYLSSVATKVFAEHDAKSKRVIPLIQNDSPWGLISIALGNLKNRNQFRDRVFFKFEDEENSKQRVNKGECLTIWEWAKQYNGVTYQQACQNFIKMDQRLEVYLSKIKKLAELHHKFINTDINAYHNKKQQEIDVLKLNEQEHIVRSEQLKLIINKILQDKSKVCSDLEQHKKFEPGFLEKIFRTANTKAYQEQLNRLRADWDNLLTKERKQAEKLNNIQTKRDQMKVDLARIYSEIKTKTNEYESIKTEYQNLLIAIKDINLPPADRDLEHDAIQLNAFWQNKKLNEIRSRLFMSALKLHEAWLAEVLKNGYFTQNLIAISHLLGNKRPVNKTDELYIWQSFFMWIPVVSSTFASIGRQFKNIGSQQLGWLLIDEAGQAVPQAAVGSIWRAKNILVVGDPLQIEPVFTIPPFLIEKLAQQSLKQNYEKWLPTLASTQTLADDANKLGAYINTSNHEQWIGCPLRVHRRCLDPMFSVANCIAYNNKMLNARISNITQINSDFEQSCWFHLPGEVTDKQYVQAQGEYLLKLFAKIYEEEKQLPKLFIITPFKRIKQNLHKLIQCQENWSHYLLSPIILPNEKKLSQWCATHIGTVHTFQGKEANRVIFVVGADHNNQGSANWASSKPNILNVALTRARDRFYIIGDYNLWSSKTYFSVLSNALPIIQVMDCMVV